MSSHLANTTLAALAAAKEGVRSLRDGRPYLRDVLDDGILRHTDPDELLVAVAGRRVEGYAETTTAEQLLSEVFRPYLNGDAGREAKA